MDVSLRIPYLPEGVPVSLQVVIATAILGCVYSVLTKDRPLAGFSLIALDGKGPKSSWMWHGKDVINKGLETCSGAFQVMTGTGPKIILPNRFADELKNHEFLNFDKAFAKDFFVEYPGFEPFAQGLQDTNLIQETVRVKLTQSLNLVTDDLVDETTASLHDIFGESPDWAAVNLTDAMLDLVARLSSRVFLGKDLCRNKEWLRIAKSYTVDSFIAALELRFTPSFLRPILYLVLPHCRKIRREVADANGLIISEVERRMERAKKALEAGQKPPKTADAIGWMYEVARGRKVDFVAGQLSLTLAAIHTTTNVLSQALLDICQYPEIVAPLREEVVQVLSEHGWAKTSLYKLKLMDSFLKESQRVNIFSAASMNRFVEKDVELSDGTVLPKGNALMVSAESFTDPNIYPEPSKFDVYRFMRMREMAGMENKAQFVSTSPEHLLFGHGQHACPGRFFASNELKVALCHLLLKYDWKFLEGHGRPKIREFEINSSVDPKCQVQFKRREEEIALG